MWWKTNDSTSAHDEYSGDIEYTGDPVDTYAGKLYIKKIIYFPKSTIVPELEYDNILGFLEFRRRSTYDIAITQYLVTCTMVVDTIVQKTHPG